MNAIWIIESGDCMFGDHTTVAVMIGTEAEADELAREITARSGGLSCRSTGPFDLICRKNPTTEITFTEEDEMPKRTDAWGSVKKSKQAAIDDAVKNLGRHANDTGNQVKGSPSYDSVVKTPTGHQARVSGVLEPKRRRDGDD